MRARVGHNEIKEEAEKPASRLLPTDERGEEIGIFMSGQKEQREEEESAAGDRKKKSAKKELLYFGRNFLWAHLFYCFEYI